MNGVWDARPQVGDRVAVVGGGHGRLPRRVAGVAHRRLRRAARGRQPAACSGGAGARCVVRATGRAEGDADIVIHASGAPEAGAALRCGGRGDGGRDELVRRSTVPLPLGGAFHSRRLTIKSSQVGQVPPAQRARWDTRRRMAHALELLADPALDVLLTGESAFEDLPDAMADSRGTPGDALCPSNHE